MTSLLISTLAPLIVVTVVRVGQPSGGANYWVCVGGVVRVFVHIGSCVIGFIIVVEAQEMNGCFWMAIKECGVVVL